MAFGLWTWVVVTLRKTRICFSALIGPVYTNAMQNSDPSLVLKELYDAFFAVGKPSPLTSYDGAHWPEEVDYFNETDWERASYSDVVEGMDGMIICPPITKVYLLPRLFRMVILRQHGNSLEAVDNLSMELEAWPVQAEVERLLSNGQKAAIVNAWSYLDQTIYSPSGSHVGRELAKHWKIERGNPD